MPGSRAGLGMVLRLHFHLQHSWLLIWTNPSCTADARAKNHIGSQSANLSAVPASPLLPFFALDLSISFSHCFSPMFSFAPTLSLLFSFFLSISPLWTRALLPSPTCLALLSPLSAALLNRAGCSLVSDLLSLWSLLRHLSVEKWLLDSRHPLSLHASRHPSFAHISVSGMRL